MEKPRISLEARKQIEDGYKRGLSAKQIHESLPNQSIRTIFRWLEKYEKDELAHQALIVRTERACEWWLPTGKIF